MTNRKFVTTLTAVGLVMASIVGCGDVNKQDAHAAPQSNIDTSAPDEIIAMPNDFGNLAIKCDKWGHRVYVTTNPGAHPSNIYVIDDPSCPGGRLPSR